MSFLDAGLKFAGGLLDRDTANKNRDQEMRIAQQNMAMQKQFAQEGIRWKVADAKEAGIHPLYALGANTVSFSPVSISGGSPSNWSETLGSMGQDISRAVGATRTEGERMSSAQEMLHRTQIEGAQLDNDIKKTELASRVQKLTQAGNPPPLPGEVPRAKEYEEIPQLRGDLGPIHTNPRTVNAEDVEKRYGDVAQELWGAYNILSDWFNHMKNNVSVHNDSSYRPTGTWRDYLPSIRYKRLYHDPRRDAR